MACCVGHDLFIASFFSFTFFTSISTRPLHHNQLLGKVRVNNGGPHLFRATINTRMEKLLYWSPSSVFRFFTYSKGKFPYAMVGMRFSA